MNTEDLRRRLQDYHVWVLAPHLESDDPNIQYYYDFSQSILEYTRVFLELGLSWTWQPVTLVNYRDIIRDIAGDKQGKKPLVLNLCDGDEINGTPGVSVIAELETFGLPYTGSDDAFYRLTTSKIPMKRAFDKAGVPHAPWAVITDDPAALEGLCEKLGAPLLIKPAVSGGSMGVSVKNVVHDDTALKARVAELKNGYRGWNLLADGLIAERFITGPEFTSFITGSSDFPERCRVYEPVERVFHPSLPEKERFLSFDRLWEIYEEETPMPENGNFYEYRSVTGPLADAIKGLSLQAYRACGGMGYTRIDIRQDAQTGKLYLLEANAQCGLSEDENYTSIGAILKASDASFTRVVEEILTDGLRRYVKTEQLSPDTGDAGR